MNARTLAGFSVSAIGAILTATAVSAQTVPATRGPAENGTPAWFLQGSFPDPGGRTSTAPGGIVTVLQNTGGGGGGGGGGGAPAAGGQAAAPAANPNPTAPGCQRSPICGTRAPGVPSRGQMMRVQYEQTMGYRFEYPINLPAGTGGVPAVAVDSQDNLWVFQRKPQGQAQLFKYSKAGELILTVGPDVIPFQVKAHGMAVDAQDNVWILDTTGATATKISPQGRVLQVIGERGKRGDWDEAKGQRLLWQPVMIAFAPNGDIYIAQGHGNESPNDAGSDDPTNNIGVSRILHLDPQGNFKNQWYGANVGDGKFYNAHALGIDPTNGDVWIGDREDYRIAVYNSAGQFLKTIYSRNLVCAIQFDRQGNPWMASGQDGQFLKLDRNGKVIGAVGNGMGIGPGQFIEASYWVFDSENNLWAGDTSVSRVTKIVAPASARTTSR